MELFNQIKTLSTDLFFDDLGSESSEAIEAVHIPANIIDLTPESFAQALQLNADNPQDFITRFLPAERILTRFSNQFYRADLNEKALQMVQLMQVNLQQHTLIVLGKDYDENVGAEHPVYVVGVADDGSLVGFKSKVIWT